MTLIGNYLRIRGPFKDSQEQFFIFRDGNAVLPRHVAQTLRKAISALGLKANFYGTHSLRIGRTTDLVKFGYSIEEVRHMGR